MITESVKTILGADLSNQVEAALKGKGKDGKDVDLSSVTTEPSSRPISTTEPTAERPAPKMR